MLCLFVKTINTSGDKINKQDSFDFWHSLKKPLEDSTWYSPESGLFLVLLVSQGDFLEQALSISCLSLQSFFFLCKHKRTEKTRLSLSHLLKFHHILNFHCLLNSLSLGIV